MSTQLFVHPLQASAEHLTASSVADAVQTLTSNDLLHHTAATLYHHLAGVTTPTGSTVRPALTALQALTRSHLEQEAGLYVNSALNGFSLMMSVLQVTALETWRRRHLSVPLCIPTTSKA